MELNGCWSWCGYRSNGYGQLRIDRTPYVSHRVAWLSLVGPIPEGLQIDHLCRNRACCNPGHLEPVTCSINLRRIPKGTQKLKSHCIQGHEMTPKNTLWQGKGKRRRVCRACRSKWNADQHLKLKLRKQHALAA
ncbi:HNH endonuclease signature motif containing protein [Arthrobacter sp. ISL-95]|uniref:HNH endonuclease signature motif containing protein n=1 Tax=Arthrobacter sp. ISL-95 TaxID=2819116 RepID=UPI0037BF27ED